MFNLSKADFRSPLGKLLRLPLKIIPAKTVLPVIQGPLKGKKWIKGSSINGCWLGTYELDKQLLFQKEIKSEMIIYDVGANVGFYSLLASVLTGDNGKVFSFEPLPENLYYLKKHIELNSLENIKIIEKAVVDRTSTTYFTASDNRSKSHLSNNGEIKVETISLDEFIAQGNPQPDLIKMDIEGSEFDALIGTRGLLKSKKSVIFLATHSAEIRVKCLKLMADFGYTVKSVDNKPLDESDEFVCK